MNTLDSRFLKVGDCYAHRFSTQGTFRYQLSPLALPLSTRHENDDVNLVTVGVANDKQQQHNVSVTQVGGNLAADPAQLEVGAGDLVVWAADKSVKLGFRVQGQLEDEVIDSAALTDESIFTHAFGLPGTYSWVDANGSGVRGEIEVAMPDAAGSDPKAWLATLEQGEMVHVQGEQASPEQVQIVVGQTVVWAIEKAPGITITDASLLIFQDAPQH
jgi:plastocyanin